MYICIYVYMYICIYVYMYICIYVDSLLVALIMKVEFFITRCCKQNGSWIPKLWHLPQPPQKEASRAFGTLIATLILLFVLCNFQKPVGASGHELRKSSISNWNPLRNHRSWEPRPVGASGHEPPGLENHRFLIKILYKIIDFERRGRPL